MCLRAKFQLLTIMNMASFVGYFPSEFPIKKRCHSGGFCICIISVEILSRQNSFRGGLDVSWGVHQWSHSTSCTGTILATLFADCASASSIVKSLQTLGGVLRTSHNAIRDGIHSPHTTPTSPPSSHPNRSINFNSFNFIPLSRFGYSPDITVWIWFFTRYSDDNWDW